MKKNYYLAAIIFLYIFAINSSIAQPLSKQSHRLLPIIKGVVMYEGYSIKWMNGYPENFSDIAKELFAIKTAPHRNWFLVGHRINFQGYDLDSKNFSSLNTTIKDYYSSTLLKLFPHNSEFIFNIGAHSFNTSVGEQTTIQDIYTTPRQTASWEIFNSDGRYIKSVKSSIRYKITRFYSLAQLTIKGSLRLNLDNSPLTTGRIKFTRLGPGRKSLNVTAKLDKDGLFEAKNLAAGFYQISYQSSIREEDRVLHKLIKISAEIKNIDLKLKYHARYSAQLKYQKKGEDFKITGKLKWDTIDLILPYGLATPNSDTSNALNTMAHFIGDFNSSILLDRQGNPLTLPYADDNMDQLVFLSWNNQATETQIKGKYQGSKCAIKDTRDNRLYLTATLKNTEYGPWILPKKRLYLNWSLSYQCGPTRLQSVQSTPQADIAPGGISELGDIQAEVSSEIISKIRQNQKFKVQWKFIDPIDHGEVVVTLQMKPIKKGWKSLSPL